MAKRRMRTSLLAVGLAASFGLSSAMLADGPAETVRLQIGYVFATSDYELPVPGSDGAVAELGARPEAGLAFEHRLSSLLGIEAAVHYGKPNVTLRVRGLEASGSMPMFSSTVGVLLHGVLGGKGEVYGGPELVYVDYGRADLSLLGVNVLEVAPKNEWTWGAKAGLDVPVGDHWTAGAVVEYRAAIAKTDDPSLPRLNPRPLIVNIGIGYRF